MKIITIFFVASAMVLLTAAVIASIMDLIKKPKKNEKNRKRSPEMQDDDSDVLLHRCCISWLDAGCSPNAVQLIMSKYKNGELSDSSAFSYAEDLQYCNDIEELLTRFHVEEEPPDKEKRGDWKNAVYGAMYGDIIGSMYEGRKIDNIDSAVNDPNQPACRLTDDSILTAATLSVEKNAENIIYSNRSIGLEDIGCDSSYPLLDNPYTKAYRDMALKYPTAGYGSNFSVWAANNGTKPYGSLGNGSAMRVSPVGALYDEQDEVIKRAAVSAMATHNHIEGVKGAVVTAVCIWMARKGYSKKQIYRYMVKHYSYGASTHLFTDFSYEEASKRKVNQVECSYSVPAAVISFYKSKDYMDAIRLSACVGYDTDTNACICGSIAGAYYGIPKEAKEVVKKKLEETFGYDPVEAF